VIDSNFYSNLFALLLQVEIYEISRCLPAHATGYLKIPIRDARYKARYNFYMKTRIEEVSMHGKVQSLLETCCTWRWTSLLVEFFVARDVSGTIFLMYLGLPTGRWQFWSLIRLECKQV